MRLLFALLYLCLCMADDSSSSSSYALSATNTSNTTIITLTSIVLENFSNPLHEWDTMNDPVMGGKSESSLKIENGIAKFTGTCAIVPFLKAPGFITMVTGGFFSRQHKESFPDVSTCQALAMTIRTNVEYSGYRVSFGREHLPRGGHAEGYKAPLVDVPLGKFEQVLIPFSKFSSKWDEATGDIEVSCQDDSNYCPSTRWLENMETISFWGEGVEGKIDLEIKDISAVGCTTQSTTSRPSVLAAANVSSTHSSVGGNILLIGIVIAVLGFMAARRQQQHHAYDTITTEAKFTTELT